MLAHATRNFITESIRSLFGGVPPRIQVAALPWREGEAGMEIMLVTSRDSKRWILPKGWPEGEESLSGTAAREALEEAGVSGSVEPREFGRYYYGKKLSSGLEWRCEVLVYPIRVEGSLDPALGRAHDRRSGLVDAHHATAFEDAHASGGVVER
jgi:8-oxo-dGTP pyrophosphatase MutT (NUDIX family)